MRRHGDALHVGNFDWDNPGLEVFSIMEDYDSSSVTYCMDMRDAKTGELLWGWPKGDRDVVTAADAVKADTDEAEGDVYNVIGQKLSPDAKGFVIKNHKILYVK